MSGFRWVRAARTTALVAMAGVSLAACATAGGPPSRTSATVSPRPHHGAPPPRDGAPRGTMKPYQVNGRWYTPRADPHYDETGMASWYGAQFHNRRTANGELFDMDVASAAHTTLPLPSIVEVTNLENGRKARLRVNDRGPFVSGRIIDLSRQAAKDLGVYDRGLARVRVRYIGPADLARPSDGVRYAETRSTPPVRRESRDRQNVRIQAAAFSDRANAERAARRLADEGGADIETVWRGDAMLYRVVVSCRGDEAADALDRISAAGFPDAKLLGGPL